MKILYFARTTSVPGEWRPAVRIRRRQLGSKLFRLLLAALCTPSAERHDVIGRRSQMRRQVDPDHLREIARAHASQPHGSLNVSAPRCG